jgi:hypothetical protein
LAYPQVTYVHLCMEYNLASLWNVAVNHCVTYHFVMEYGLYHGLSSTPYCYLYLREDHLNEIQYNRFQYFINWSKVARGHFSK